MKFTIERKKGPRDDASNANFPVTAHTKQTKKTESSESYLFVGMPHSGKTTFFCCMAEHLEQLAIQSEKFIFRYCGKTTMRFIKTQMNLLRHGSWPDKTQVKNENYSFQLKYTNTILNVPLWSESVDIVYHDYPGEAFRAAFNDDEGKHQMYREDAENLKVQLECAKGIFLMLDAEEIFNSTNIQETEETLVSFFQYLQNMNRRPKQALVFNKLELVNGYVHSKYLKRFTKKYATAAMWLKGLEHEFFSVYTIGECKFSNGVIIPPEELHPRAILKPINWMINFL